LAATIVRTAGINAGLCVQLNSTDGRLAAELAGQGTFIVHGITPNAAETQKMRRYLPSRNLHETVSVEHGSLSRLPYASNLANLVVVEDVDAALKAGLSLDEVTRVLCPGGVAYLGRKSAPATVIRKKRPLETDEWTHWLHGPKKTCDLHLSPLDRANRDKGQAGPKDDIDQQPRSGPVDIEADESWIREARRPWPGGDERQ
jgi:hypothetical protein